MSDASRILTSVDVTLPVESNDLAEAIDAFASCASACTACADACLGESDIEHMRSCIRACIACADLCEVTVRFLSRTGGYDVPVVRNLLETVAKACATCSDICGGHAEVHKHCRVCADACRRCEQAAQRLLTQLAAAVV
jgi:uncharacterized membrane protein